jgi:hypothetical protein
MTNHHMTPGTKALVHHLLKCGHTPQDIAERVGCSVPAARYQQNLLIMAGEVAPAPCLPPRPREHKPCARQPRGKREAGPGPRDDAYHYHALICIVGGCTARRTIGVHCDRHQPGEQIARATAGLSEATRRKLTGGRA